MRSKTFSFSFKPVLICYKKKNYEERTIKLEQTSRFLCDENAEMLMRSPEWDLKGEK